MARAGQIHAQALKTVGRAADAAEAVVADGKGTRAETKLAIGRAQLALTALAQMVGIDPKTAANAAMVAIFADEEATRG